MVNMERYDAGLLNGYGGGNVDWWFDYIRAEIERCNDHWEQQNALLAAEVERLRQWKADVEETHRQVMDEKCPSDEQHCTCVPILRRELAHYREGFGLAMKVMGDCEETLRHVLHYVEGQGLSAEQDVKESIEMIHMFRDAEAVRMMEGEDARD